METHNIFQLKLKFMKTKQNVFIYCLSLAFLINSLYENKIKSSFSFSCKYQIYAYLSKNKRLEFLE